MQVNVREISALREFRVSLDQFRDVVMEAMSLARRELEEILALIEERQTAWRQQISHWEDEVDRARADLRRCEEGDEEDEDGSDGDCTDYEDALTESLRRHRAAEEELAVVLRWKQDVLERAETFDKVAHQLADLTEREFERGRAFLQDKAATLEDYAGATGMPITSFQSAQPGLVKSGLASAPLKNGSSVWRDRGISAVPLSAIDLTDCPKDATDFRKVPYETMREGVRKLLDEVWPAVKRGAGHDYFAGLDRDSNTDYEHGLLRVYEAFFGMEPIRLEKNGERYVVVNGRHRLAVARDLGVMSLPASVTEKDQSSSATSRAE